MNSSSTIHEEGFLVKIKCAIVARLPRSGNLRALDSMQIADNALVVEWTSVNGNGEVNKPNGMHESMSQHDYPFQW